jgi:hypothetical protein
MTELQKTAEHEQVSTFESQKQSHTGFPFSKIVYVGDLVGGSSYPLRYARQLAHEHHAELVVVHSLDPIVYALPGATLRDGAANEELTAMERANLRRDPARGQAPRRIPAHSRQRGANSCW